MSGGTVFAFGACRPGELTGLVQRLKPRTCFLVHGDAEARGALSSMVDVYLLEGVQLPENGGAYTVETMRAMRQRGYGRRVSRAGIAGGRPLSDETLSEVRNYVVETGAQGPFRAQELAEMWFGTEMTTPSEVEAFRLLLSDSRRFLSRIIGVRICSIQKRRQKLGRWR